jgi:hypothetical protein
MILSLVLTVLTILVALLTIGVDVLQITELAEKRILELRAWLKKRKQMQ